MVALFSLICIIALSKTVHGADNFPLVHATPHCIQDPTVSLLLVKKGHTNICKCVCCGCHLPRGMCSGNVMLAILWKEFQQDSVNNLSESRE